LWRVGLLCATLTHEQEHPALAILILVPLNHILFTLTSRLGRPADLGRDRRERIRFVVAPHLLATIGVVVWYGSFGALIGDIRSFSQTREWWGIVFTVFVLSVLYRPIITALGHLVGATGLHDYRLWSALFLAIGVWLWCDGVFAGLFQQLSLLCDGPAPQQCGGERAFSQPLIRFVDAAYFSTITLSTTGYGDVTPISDLARGLVMVEIAIGYGLLGFLLSRVAGITRAAGDRGPP
jgi:ion channel